MGERSATQATDSPTDLVAKGTLELDHWVEQWWVEECEAYHVGERVDVHFDVIHEDLDLVGHVSVQRLDDLVGGEGGGAR